MLRLHLLITYAIPFILFLCPVLPGLRPTSGVFPSILRSLSRSPPLVSLPSPSSHCPLIFMQLAGRPCSASLSLSVGEEAASLPAANGLLENTDGHASQSRERGREGREIWSEARGKVISEGEGGRHTSGRLIVKEKLKLEGPPKHRREKRKWERKSSGAFGSCDQ